MLTSYLKEIFGEDIHLIQIDLHGKLPLLLIEEYDFFQAKFAGFSCVFLHYKGKYLSLKRLGKHFSTIRNSIGNASIQMILWLDSMTKAQRTKFIGARIPFVVPSRQAYFPFAYMDFTEQYPAEKEPEAQFTVATQCVYIWLFYQPRRPVGLPEVADALHLAPITISRAFKDLGLRALVESIGSGTRKKFERIERKAFWESGHGALITPVKQILYIEAGLELNVSYYTAGESALSVYTMLSEPDYSTYAIYKKDVDSIISHCTTSLDGIEETSWSRIEVWKYNPRLFASIEIDNVAICDEVDKCSLFASMVDNDDMRVSIALDEMMEELLEDEGN